MNPIASDRLARGLMAAGAGIDQMAQTRMQEINLMFKEKLANMQAQQHKEDVTQRAQQHAQDMLQRQLNFDATQKRLAKDEADSHADRMASLKQRAGEAAQRLDIARQELQLRRADFDRKVKAGGVDSAAFKVAQGVFNAAQSRLDSIQKQLDDSVKLLSGVGTSTNLTQQQQQAASARLNTQIANLTTQILSYKMNADNAYQKLAEIGGESPVRIPKPGDRMYIGSDGRPVPYDAANPPKGLKLMPWDGRTPLQKAPVGTTFTLGNPSQQQPPASSGAGVPPMPNLQQDNTPPTPGMPPMPGMPPGGS